jgi:hypothetical protein
MYKIGMMLSLLLCAGSIFSGSDAESVLKNNENIVQIVQGNNQLQLPQARLDKFFDFIDSEGAPAIFWGGFAVCFI